MNYFFSGIGTFTGELRERLALLCPHRLQSCHGAYIKNAYQWAELAGKDTELMLDSGAFTAWSKGSEVKLDHLIDVYGDLVNKYEHRLKAIWLINLDRIPGSPGRTAGKEEIDAAIVESDKNFEVLVKHFGPRVLPVFHQNETTARLKEVATLADYICVSPRNDLPEASRVSWSKEVHTELGPNVKTHGLATTGDRMLTQVGWHSADSASWVFAGAMGNIMIKQNNRIYSVSVSSDSPAKKQEGKHFDNMTDLERAQVVARVEHHGFTMDDVAVSHGIRMAINMLEIIEWMKELEVKPVLQKGLFDL